MMMVLTSTPISALMRFHEDLIEADNQISTPPIISAVLVWETLAQCLWQGNPLT
jgi:hypothetical protein